MRLLRAVALTLTFLSLAAAHVGSPDVYLDANAGPYKLFVTIRPPDVIPGVAELKVRSQSPGITHISAVPLPVSGPGAKYAPVPDHLKQSESDPQYFTGALWLMAPGSWQVKVSADGPQGSGVVSVPIPSIALRTKTMDRPLGFLLATLMLCLVVGIVATVGSAVREAELPPGVRPSVSNSRKAWRAAILSALAIIGALWYGAHWWHAEAESYGRNVFKPLDMSASLNGATLLLRLSDPGWNINNGKNFGGLPTTRSVDDLVPDHGHLMHLYAIRQPGLDVVFHLHPEQSGAGQFRLQLPNMPAGEYKLYADVVHENGLPETLVSAISVPAIATHPVSGDDAEGSAAPYTRADVNATEFPLQDGYRMQWLREPGVLHSRQPLPFRFRLLDNQDHPPSDMALYMGMLGHAAFVKPDGTVFAHIHPTGSVPMAAFMRVNMGMDHSMMHHSMGVLPNEVAFPYGFPSPGRYRIFVQMKHGDTVETGVFDAAVQ